MSKAILVQCSRCGSEVAEDLSFVLDGETLCEDCYLKALQRRPKGCDPWHEYFTSHRIR